MSNRDVAPSIRGRITLALLAALVWPFSAQALDRNGTYIIWGPGANTCEQWATARRERSVPSADQSWIQGFVSSHNHYADGPNDLGKGITPDALRSWVDSYCTQHPHDLLVRAAETLVIELIRSHPPYDHKPDPSGAVQ